MPVRPPLSSVAVRKSEGWGGVGRGGVVGMGVACVGAGGLLSAQGQVTVRKSARVRGGWGGVGLGWGGGGMGLGARCLMGEGRDIRNRLVPISEWGGEAQG